MRLFPGCAWLERHHVISIFLGAALGASLLSVASRVNAEEAAERGRTWLGAHRGADGAWRSERDPRGVGTTARVSAVLEGPESELARQWLATKTAATLSESAAASAVLGVETPASLGAPLTAQKVRFGRWGSSADAASTPYHTALALLTLAQISTDQQAEVASARDYLSACQFPEGSWGVGEKGQDAITATATVLEALLVSGTPPAAPAVARARDWLVSRQNVDGGWGVDGSAPAVTAQALRALRWVGGWSREVEIRAAAYLEATQASDGSWEADPWTTALAVSALSNVGVPDLCFAPGGVAPGPDPVPGDRWPVSVAVTNRGTVEASAISVQLRLTDGAGVEVFAEERSLEDLGPGGVASVVFSVDTGALAGMYAWSVRVDPADLVREGDEENNLAGGTVDVGGTRSLSLVAGSLRVLTSDGLLELAPSTLSAGAAVLLRVQLRSAGTRQTGPVEVWFYWGDPASGVLVGSTALASVPADALIDVSVPWTIGVMPGPGSLVAAVDPRRLIVQTSPGAARSELPAAVASADMTPPEPPDGLTANLVSRDHVDLSWQASPSPDVVGYRLWRDGLPVNAVDLAPASAPSASDSYNLREYLPGELRALAAFDPPNLVDGDPTTSWWSIRRPYEPWEPEACYVQFLLSSPQSLRAVVVQWYDFDLAARDFRIQVWTGAAWADAAVVRGNLQERSVVVLPAAVVTDRVRVQIDEGLDREAVGIREVALLEAGSGRLIQATSFVDTTLAAVPARYAVTAVDAAGNESAPSAPFVLADLRPPVVQLTAPAAGKRVGPEVPVVGTVTDDFLQGYALDWAEGDYVDTDPSEWQRADEKAEPVSDGGLFNWRPPAGLDGPVTLRLHAVDGGGIGNIREQRVRVWVDTVAPAQPTHLVTSLDDIRLTLTWTPNAEVDLSGYRVVANGEETGLADVARDGVASASATFSDALGARSPGLAVDGDRGSYWRPPEDAYPCWWALDFSASKIVRRVLVIWRSPLVARRFRVETKGADGVWLPRWSTDDNEDEDVRVEFASAMPALGVRIVVLEGVLLGSRSETAPGGISEPPAPYPALAEVQVLADTLLALPVFETSFAEDREYGLTVEAVDDLGNRSTPSQAAVVDLRGPRIALLAPRAGDRVGRAVVVKGWVQDRYLKDYAVEVGAIAASGQEPAAWEEIHRSMTPVPWNRVMTVWYPTLRKGLFALRLTARDEFGQVSAARREFILDAMPPEAPEGLSETDDPDGVTLSWNPSVREADDSGAAQDLVGYRVYRDGVPLTVSDVAFLAKASVPMGTARVLRDCEGTPYVANIGGPTSHVNDALAKTVWEPEPFSPQAEIILDLPQPFVLSAVGIDWAPEDWFWGRDYTASVWDDRSGSWVTVAQVRDGYGPRAEHAFAPRATDRVRIVLERGPTAYSLGAISEIHLRRPEEADLVSGTTYRDPAAVGVEAAYRVTAVDQFGNESPKSNRVSVDHLAPRVALTAPAAGELRLRAGTWVPIAGTVDDPLLREYRVEVGEGDSPVFWQTLTHQQGVLLPILTPAALAFWVVPSGVEGPITFRLTATDEGGRQAQARVAVRIDTRAPPPPTGLAAVDEGATVRLIWQTPGEPDVAGYHVYRNGKRLDVADVAGSATAKASSWPGRDELVGAWRTIDGDPLTTWVSSQYQVPAWVRLLFDGAYPIVGVALDWEPYLLAEDFSLQRWDEEAADWVDLATVAGLQANPWRIDLPAPVRADRLRVYLTRSVDRETLRFGIREFHVYRGPGAETPTEPLFVDDAVGPREYTYLVTAFDAFGNESAPSEEVHLDTVAPRVSLTSPSEGARVGRHVEIEGTVADRRLQDYRLEVGRGATPSAYRVVDVWATAVDEGVVAVWDPPAGEDGPWRLRLVARDLTGTETAVERAVWVDTSAPPPPLGLVAALPDPSSVDLRWGAVSTADLAGYNVYRQGRLLNDPLVSPLGVATASENRESAGEPIAAVRQKTWRAWAVPCFWEERFPSKVTIDRVELVWEKAWGVAPPRDYELQVQVDGAWKTVVMIWNNAFQHRVHEVPSAAPSARFRIFITEPERLRDGVGLGIGLSTVRLFDLKRGGLIADSRYVDGGLLEIGGVYRVAAVDLWGNESAPSDPVTVDDRPPRVSLASPVGAEVVTGPLSVTGSVEDTNLLQWRLEVGEGAASVLWEEVATGRGQMLDVELGRWNPPDGVDRLYTLRLCATDFAGQAATTTVTMRVLTRRPSAPADVTAQAAAGGEVRLTWNPPLGGAAVGYNAYRNAERLNRTNVAPLAAVTASYNSAGPESFLAAAHAADERSDTIWAPEPFLSPAWIAFQFPQPFRIGAVSVDWYKDRFGTEFLGTDYQIQVRDGAGWRTVVFVENNRASRRYDALPEAVTTDGIRLLITAGTGDDIVGVIREVQILTDQPQDAVRETTFVDDGLSLVEGLYAVAAVDAYGRESEPATVLADAVAPRLRVASPSPGDRVTLDLTLYGRRKTAPCGALRSPGAASGETG